MNSVQAEGSRKRRSVCPVGAVSKMTWSKLPPGPVAAISPVNSSKAATSTVHPPDSCSSIRLTASSGSTPRYGPTERSR